MGILVTKYNEVSPGEIETLMEAGAEIIKSGKQNGVLLNAQYNAYSDDSIKINNVILPLSLNGDYSFYIFVN